MEHDAYHRDQTELDGAANGAERRTQDTGGGETPKRLVVPASQGFVLQWSWCVVPADPPEDDLRAAEEEPPPTTSNGGGFTMFVDPQTGKLVVDPLDLSRPTP